MDLKLSLNVGGLNVGEELADEGGNDADGSDDEWEVDSLWSVEHGQGGGGHDQGGVASRLVDVVLPLPGATSAQAMSCYVCAFVGRGGRAGRAN